MNSIQNGTADIKDSLYLLDFLDSIGKILFNTERGEYYFRQLYEEHIKQICKTEKDISESLAAIIGYIYIGIFYTKESSIDILPDIKLNSEGNGRGETIIFNNISNYSNLGLKYVIKKIKNSFTCRNFKINIPKNIKSKEIFKNVNMTFYDISSNDKSDIFEINLSIGELVNLVGKLNSEIYKNYTYKKWKQAS